MQLVKVSIKYISKGSLELLTHPSIGILI